MLVYLLFILLFLNLWIIYQKTKDVICPPFLFGSGLCVASFVELFYIKEWDLQNLEFRTFWIIIVGVYLFSITYFLLMSFQRSKKQSTISVSFDNSVVLRKSYARINIFLMLSVFLQLFVIYIKLKTQVAVFGSLLSFEQLLAEANASTIGERDVITYPTIYYYLAGFCKAFFYYYSFFLVTIILDKTNKYKINLPLLIANIMLGLFLVILNGNRGSVVELLFVLIILYVSRYVLIYKHRLSYKIFLIFCLVFLAFYSLLNVSASWMGRNISEQDFNSNYYSAVYCGSQIKNLQDMTSKSVNKKDIIGSSTLRRLYKDLGIKKNEIERGEFLYTNGYFMGNVYTTFYNFYDDGKMSGVVFFCLLMSIISFFSYVNNGNSTYKLGLYDMLYAKIGFALFMSFFSCKFFEEIICVNMIRQIVYFLLSMYFINNYVLLKK